VAACVDAMAVWCRTSSKDNACGNGNEVNLACSGSWWVVSAWLEPPGADGVSDILCPLTRWGLLHARGSNELILDFSGGSVLFESFECGASLLTILAASSK
jgi:hypothetical protein